MAFLSRFSNLLKQSTSNPSLFEAIRSMSTSSKVFVGGLSYSTDDMSLSEAFSKYGEVVEARVVIDRNTGRSRGFAFVTYTSTEAASSAIQAFDGQELHGRRIRVNYAVEKSRSGGFGGGFGSGDGFNFGGSGGNLNSGGYQGGSFGDSGGGNYSGRYGNYTGSGEFGNGNRYPSGGDRFGGNDNFTGGGSLQGHSNYGAGGGNYYDSESGASFPLYSQTTGTNGNSQGQGINNQGGIDAKVDDFGQEIDGNERDDHDEPSEYANSRG